MPERDDDDNIIDMKLDRKRSTKKHPVYSGGSISPKAVLDAVRPKPKTGRPPSITQDKQDLICDLIASGKSVNEIGSMEGMPCADTIFGNVARDEGFFRKYMRAREAQQFVLADRAVAIAAGTDPMCFRETPQGIEMLDAAERRLIMDTIRWQTGKLAARVFGDRVAVTGHDGGAVQIEATRKVDLASLPPEQLAQFEAMLKALPKPVDGDK